MPIPSQPTTNISLGPTLAPTNRSISNEFGEAQPSHALSQFYRGGSFVANHPINNSVPTSGSVAMSQFNGSSIVLKYNIQSNLQNLNLYDYATSGSRQTGQAKSQGYMVNERYVSGDYGIEFQIGPGVEITTAARTQASLSTGTGWGPGVKIRLVNQGLILGGGGGGGLGGSGGPARTDGQPGESGGTALDAQFPITIDNVGTIAGGGGGGGGGDGTNPPGAEKAFLGSAGGGGGGGAGQAVGTGGASGGQYTNNGVPGNGQPGQPNAGGQGGIGDNKIGNQGGNGGAGGGRGAAGSAGTYGQQGGPHIPGGAAGYYVFRPGAPITVTYQQTGTRQGQAN